MRAIGIVAVVIALAFILAAGISYAKQVPLEQSCHRDGDLAWCDIPQFATQKAISAVSDIPPCFTHPDKPKRVWWVIMARDGTQLIVGDEGVRKRC